MKAAPAKSFKAAAVQFVPAWGGVHGNISPPAAGTEELAKQPAGAVPELRVQPRVQSPLMKRIFRVGTHHT